MREHRDKREVDKRDWGRFVTAGELVDITRRE
jgi:hypothetical protein